MSDHKSTGRTLQTPVLLIIFKRLDTTEKVFEAIRKAKPVKLYVAADGPRATKEGEAEQAQATRDIIKRVDWNCEVKTLFQDHNLGCGVGPSTAISWLFENEETGIILEDDCLPSESFFWYCEELLEKYRHDTRIMQISGVNPLLGWRKDPDYDYYFSEAGITWGWATWRRAWNLYNYTIPHFQEIKDKGYIESFHFYKEKVEWMINCLDEAYRRLPSVSWWDFQWEFTKFSNSGLSIVPNVSLVKNIGFGEGATHTFETVGFAVAETKDITLPLRHPSFVIRDIESDNLYYSQHLRTTLFKKVKKKLKRLLAR
ncbi:nucleotide-diphospho-sugar transferase [Cytophagaceae bacterium YF14B1]|uniref:Nucleotide-diphospho-sugar transferase n=1 Tax=Xanthocytophaga flava TaxID=3048013 RepID=A0AAE3QXB4_9BACT|nr:nucleotide-diphospho-sugar transferase [Xanthocytophaga flavus]MDJ1485270.1 nucleotide-diphospho-sugar transferase [Xanthocytophaga flavus]